METVISLQDPPGRFSHSTKAELSSKLRRVFGAGGEQGAAASMPRGGMHCLTGSSIPPPAEDSDLPNKYTGHLPILPAASDQPKSLNASSLESVPGCGWIGSWHPYMLFIHPEHKIPVALLHVLSTGQKCCGLACSFHLRMLSPSNAQKGKLHLLAVFAVLQNLCLFPWSKSTWRKFEANTTSGERSCGREQR